MSSDPESTNEADLLSQIDELKARMDRLMSGGTATSNSALLTDKPEARAPVAPPPGPNRTTVRDLIDNEDTEIIESYPGPKEVVPFPEDREISDERSAAPPAPQPIDVSRPVGGSDIPMEDDPRELKPRFSSLNDLGSAIQQELAKDNSVPPAETKKGPDLASRFGPPDEVAPSVADEEASGEAVPVVEEEAGDEPEAGVADAAGPEEYTDGRGYAGKVAAIWVITAVASGAIAALHFAGII